MFASRIYTCYVMHRIALEKQNFTTILFGKRRNQITIPPSKTTIASAHRVASEGRKSCMGGMKMALATRIYRQIVPTYSADLLVPAKRCHAVLHHRFQLSRNHVDVADQFNSMNRVAHDCLNAIRTIRLATQKLSRSSSLPYHLGCGCIA